LLPAHRPHVFAIFVPSLLCMLFHSLLSVPHASEATRGHLHGGVIIDFIGQRPPTSKLGFLFLDLAILGAQCLMLAVHQEREKLRKIVLPSLQTATAAAQTESAVPPETTQDHDAEERGVLRDNAHAGDDGNGIELQPLSEGRSRQEEGGGSDNHEPLGASYSPIATRIDLVDIMRSGNAILGDFHVVHAVRTVGNDYQGAAAQSLQSLGYSATLAAAIAAERRARLGAQQRR
jgi:Fungal domain of unknown function (DUF1746)